MIVFYTQRSFIVYSESSNFLHDKNTIMKQLLFLPLVVLPFIFISYGNQNSGLKEFKVDAVPNIEITGIEPVDGSGNVVFQISAAKTSTEKLTAQLSVYLKLKNKEAKTIYLTGVTYNYINNGKKTLKICKPDNGDKDTIFAGNEYTWQNSRGYNKQGDVILLESPFPSTLKIVFSFEGYNESVTISKTVKSYVNDIPPGAYSFPLTDASLRYGEYWNARSAHAGGSQVFALDIGAKGYNYEKKEWSSFLPGTTGKKNTDYRCYGKPVYAMADGEIFEVTDGLQENSKPGEKLEDVIAVDAGGNHIIILNGNETAKYSHFQKNSINKKLKKGTKVQKGDFLGLLGNSGNSDGPHLHIHVNKYIADKTNPFRPLQFKDIYIIDADAMSEPDPGAKWTKVNKAGLPFETCFIWPDAKKPCWYPYGLTEVARHGIAENNYQEEFNKIWSCGYYPVWVDAYDVGGKTFFNTIFRYNANNYDVEVRHNINKTKYQQEYDEWVKQKGYRLQQLDNYNDQGQLKFAAIFIKKPGQPNPQPTYHGLSPEEHQKLFDTYTGQGFVPVNVSVTSVAGKIYYSAFYEKRNVGGNILKSFLSQQEYQTMFDDNNKKGWEQVYINAYHHDGQTRFSVIWYQNSGFSSNSATRKSSSENYQDKWEANTGNGLLTRCVTGYDEGGKHWFAAHWAK